MIATRRAWAALLVAGGVSCGGWWAAPAAAQIARLTERDIIEAYEYMVGRWLVLRQETLDLKAGLKWNEIVHREPAGAAGGGANLGLALSEAWVAIDEASCTLIDLPEIKGRYYTVQALNGWGEVTANINERNYPKHPFGKFALCLKDSKPPLPRGTQRVELPSRKSRILVRIELGAKPAEAVALQKKVTLKALGSPKADKAVAEFAFADDKLPGVEAFERTTEILAAEPDINKGMVGVQEKVQALVKAIADPAERARIDEVIRKRAIPAFLAEMRKPGASKQGWARPRAAGNYGSDYLMRSIVNLTGSGANSTKEVIDFNAMGIDGNQTYTQTYPADALPASKARYFWSLVVHDGAEQRAAANPPNRFLLDKQSALQLNPDGSLTLAFAPRLPPGVPQSNWLPSPEGRRYSVVLRLYGPAKEVADGAYYPPPLVPVRR
jgi:hypothetical protein